MKQNWRASFQQVIESEGGYVNDPHDHGGETNLGVTRAAWGEYMGRPIHDGEMRCLTVEAVEPFYKDRYWKVCRCDELPAGVDYLVFDFAVNAGPSRAIKFLQRSVGAVEDGVIGPKTMAAVANADAAKTTALFSQAKEAFYQGIVLREPSQRKFIKGWLSRVDTAQSFAKTMLT